jgi:AIPR protein/Abortive infection phage resistance protein N-terminal domain
MEGRSIEEFVLSLEQAIDDQLARSPGWLRRDAFARVTADYLIEDGTLEELEICFYQAPAGRSKMEVSGYATSDGGQVLDLVVTSYGRYGQPLPSDQVYKRFRWATNFAAACRDGLHLSLEESSPPFDMAQAINAQWPQFAKIRIFLLTDGRASIGALPEEQISGLPVQLNLWDIERIRRLATSGRLEEDISIDLPALGGAVRCLPAESTQVEYQSILTVLPGRLLADMYDRYGAKLLQRNVRAFLQLRGKVNQGIIKTIREQPGQFLAYNNGISATATSVVFDERPDGTYLVKLEALQVVNGGQTTATLHAAAREGADLTQVQVPAKITVVPADQLDQLVPKISRYANSQNAVAEADFESNSPFHVELERLSRTIWAPAQDGKNHQTHWYYERVRGQYQVDRARQPTPARRRDFDEANPSSQKITKTDAAKYDMTVRGQPHIVSLGAQKCFQVWTAEVLAARTQLPSGLYFHNLVAKAILFEQSRKYIQRWNPGAGYLANVTTYTIARLVTEVNEDAVLLEIWRQQMLPEHLVEAVQRISIQVRRILLAAPGSGNVTEWSKKAECWKRVQSIA